MLVLTSYISVYWTAVETKYVTDNFNLQRLFYDTISVENMICEETKPINVTFCTLTCYVTNLITIAYCRCCSHLSAILHRPTSTRIDWFFPYRQYFSHNGKMMFHSITTYISFIFLVTTHMLYIQRTGCTMYKKMTLSKVENWRRRFFHLITKFVCLI